MLTSGELHEKMRNYYGSETLYKFPLLPYTFTEGVAGFVEGADAWWFVCDTMTYIDHIIKHVQEDAYNFSAVYLTVHDDETADLKITDGDDKVFKEKHYSYTDCPKGEYVFFFECGTLLWHMEH